MNGPEQNAEVSLVARIRSGNREAFGRLMDEHLPLAYRLSFRLLGSPDDAKDACQEAFVKVWEHLDAYDDQRPFEAWLTTIVTRTCLDRLRSRQRSPFRWFSPAGREPDLDPPDQRPDPQQAAEWSDLSEIVLKLLRRLSPTQRIVFALRDLEAMDVDEVARVAGLTVGSVKTNLSYARRAIRQWLADEYHVEESHT